MFRVCRTNFQQRGFLTAFQGASLNTLFPRMRAAFSEAITANPWVQKHCQESFTQRRNRTIERYSLDPTNPTHFQEFDRLAEACFVSQNQEDIPQEMRICVLNILNNDPERWEILFDRLLEAGNLSTAMQLWRERLPNHCPNEILVTKFWELFYHEAQKPETDRTKLFNQLSGGHDPDRIKWKQGIPPKAVSLIIQHYSDKRKAPELFEWLRDIPKIKTEITKEDFSTLLKTLHKTNFNDLIYYTSKFPEPLILHLCEELFNREILSGIPDDFLFYVLTSAPRKSLSNSSIIKFWEWVLKKSETLKTNNYFLAAARAEIPFLDPEIANKVGEAILQEITKDLNRRIDPEFDFSAENLFPKLESLICFIYTLKTENHKELKDFFQQYLKQLERIIHLPLARKSLRLNEFSHPQLLARIEELLGFQNTNSPSPEEHMNEKKAREILSLSPEQAEDRKSIEKAYRKAAMENHPDLKGASSKETMQQINAAKEVLMRGAKL